MYCTALVLSSGCRGGQTAPTVHPALAKAIASRAVGNQRSVVATKTVGFNFVPSSLRSPGCGMRTTCISSRKCLGYSTTFEIGKPGFRSWPTDGNHALSKPSSSRSLGRCPDLRCCSAAEDRTTVYVHDLAGNVARPVGAKEHDDVGHVIGQGDASSRPHHADPQLS